jgi:hypothetical protein
MTERISQSLCGRWPFVIAARLIPVGLAVILVGLFAPVWSADAPAKTYYLDSKAGDDAHDGTAPGRAWRTLAKANAVTLQPGDRLLLKAGGSWDGLFQPHGSGTTGRPVVIDRFGEGPKPVLHGRGQVPCVLRLENQQWIEVNNLEITNTNAGGPKDLRAVEVRAHDIGVVHHVHLKNLHIHDVNAVSDYKNDGSTVAKSFGGLATIIDGKETPTAWDDLLIEGCEIHDIGPIGLVMMSTWMAGHKTYDPKTWFPSKHVVIRGNRLERIKRNGMIVRGSVGPLIEHNVFRECGMTGSGNACFSFHCDDAVFQYNESSLTRYNPGDSDASGFDSDYNCRRSVFQFNFSHDNEYGFMVICCQPPKGFNEGTIVRYNVSQNDGGNIFHISGAVAGAQVYNNTIYAGEKMVNPKPGDPPRIVHFKSWNKGWADNVEFFNNIFVNNSKDAVYEMGSSTNTRFRRSLFFGQHPKSEPPDAEKLTADPLLAHPGGASDGLSSAIAAYSLRPGSPALRAGFALPGWPATDFAGRAMKVVDGRVDLGALTEMPRTK